FAPDSDFWILVPRPGGGPHRVRFPARLRVGDARVWLDPANSGPLEMDAEGAGHGGDLRLHGWAHHPAAAAPVANLTEHRQPAPQFPGDVLERARLARSARDRALRALLQ